MRWEGAEAIVQEVCAKYFPGTKLTLRSGGVHGDGDVSGPPVHIDVKYQSRGLGFTVRAAEWEKIKQQAARHHPPKEPIQVTVNGADEALATCSLDFLMFLLSRLPKGEL